MEFVNLVIKFFQDNWIALVLVVTAIILFLKVIADFRVDLAKLTPDKKDDEEAILFKAKVGIFIKAMKNLFKIGGKRGFVSVELLLKYCCILLAVVGIAFGFMKPAKVERNYEAETALKQQVETLKTKIAELEEYKKTSEEKASYASKEKEYYPSGVLKSEKDINKETLKYFDEEIKKSTQISIDYQKVISELQEKIKAQEIVRNGLLRTDLRGVYDSDRGFEYEASVSKSIHSGSAGINPDKKAWRVGYGLGHSW